jgi:ferredoxin
MKLKSPLRVRVDRERCQGHARCVNLASELFEFDELGHGREIHEGLVRKGEEEKAWLAKVNCPEAAIEIIEEYAPL